MPIRFNSFLSFHAASMPAAPISLVSACSSSVWCRLSRRWSSDDQDVPARRDVAARVAAQDGPQAAAHPLRTTAAPMRLPVEMP